ncbi:MAG: acyltransferase [Methylococcales bacterium]|nr:acyltransferase [Methylococcales bacterium]MDD5631656.1 acyltransferase [Methylococcales bacterium]
MKTKIHQYDGIQALRFLAALLVVITHSSFYASERLGTHNMIWGNGADGVDIFFVISGFVMVISSRNLIDIPLGWARFAIQRLTRIIPLYWLATSVKVIVLLFSAEVLTIRTFDIGDIVNSYFFIPYKKTPQLIEPFLGVGWTLTFEMFFYLVFTIALLIRVNIYIFVGILMALISVLSLFRPESYPVWMFLLNPIVLEFWFGMIIGYFALNNKFITPFFGVVFSVLCLLWIIFKPHLGLSRVIMSGIPSAILIFSVVSIEPYIQNKIPRLVLFFGAASYSLYLFHPLIAPAVPILLNKIHAQILILSIVMSTITALTASAIVYRYFELSITHAVKRLPFISIYTHKPLIEIEAISITADLLSKTTHTKILRDE